MTKTAYTYIFIGGPGSGKGTQSELLQQEINGYIIDVGSVLRQRARRHDKIARDIMANMMAGKMVPDHLLQDILEPIIKKAAGHTIILDGYCRNITQVSHINDWYKRKVIAEPIVIEIDINSSKTLDRIKHRRYCEKCQEIRYVNNREECTVCSGPLIKRSDDDPKVFAKRIKTYHTQSVPAKKLLEKTYKVIRIDGDAPIIKVHRQLIQQLKTHGLN